MANTVDLLILFATGQGAGAGTYVNYAADLDFNFAQIETSINQLVAEVSAINGQNALLAQDMLTSSSPLISSGILGTDSFAPVTFTGGNTTINVPRGVALTAVGRIEKTTTTVLVGSGSSGTRWVALRQDGTITLEVAASQGVLDLYSANWNGTVFSPATATRLPGILPDGDDFANFKITTSLSAGASGLPARTYDRLAGVIKSINLLLQGATTGNEGETLGRIAIGGTVSLPGIILGDGVSVFESDTGFYRVAADRLGVSVNATQALEWGEGAADEPQTRVRAGTTLAQPPWAWLGDLNTGFGWVSADIHRSIVGAAEAMRWVLGSAAHTEVPLGTAALPAITPLGDPNTGLWSSGADTLNWSTGGVEGMNLNPQQQRSSATQGRSSATRATAQNLANNTITAILFDTAEQYDVGAYHSTVTNPDRFTVPTGHGGHFSAVGYVTFLESTSATPNVGERGVQITVNGTVVYEARHDATDAGDTILAIAGQFDLVATDIVRMTAFQNSGNTMDISPARFSLHKAE